MVHREASENELLSCYIIFSSAFSPPALSRFTTFHKMQHRRLNYTGALAACRANYTDLATVYTDEDNENLKNMTASLRHFGWFIGLYRSQPSEKWSNGDDVTFSNLKEIMENQTAVLL